MDRQLLATLLVKVGIIAGIAAILARSARFKELLFRDTLNVGERIELGMYFGGPIALGILMRAQFSYNVPDLGVEGALLAGLLGGYLAGSVSGFLAALPALFAGEWFTLPVLLLIGLVGGTARRLSPETENIWHFSPFVDMNIFRWVRRRWGKPRGDWQLLFFLTIVVVEAWSMLLARFFPHRLFSLHHPYKSVVVVIVAAGIACVSIPIKIWNNTRNELKLEEQNRLLVEARMAALTGQINPHFLFNTLNSISSLIRTDPEQARRLILKLSSILRRLLRRQEAFAPLREELDLVEDYLSIERVRFGDKLQVIREVEDDTLEAMAPSMLLQPLVENSIKHGIGPKVEGGEIHIRSSRSDGRLHIEVTDNGLGIPAEKLEGIFEDGVGLSNVRERLKTLYGSDYSFRVHSEPGQGTRVEIQLPDLQTK